MMEDDKGITTLEGYRNFNKQEVKPTLKELERLKQFRDDHESDFMENNVRFNNRSDQIRREIEILNAKIEEEISNHQDLQQSEFIDHENDEFMIGHEDSVGLYSWMKEKLLEKWYQNLELQEKKFKQYLNKGQAYYFMHLCGTRQLNIEDPKELDVSELMFEQIKPTPTHDLHPANCNYQIQMKVNSPPSSREDSSEEESTDENDEANED